MHVPPRFWQNFDWLLLGLTCVAAAAGVIGIASASGTSLHSPAVMPLVKRQVEAILLGLGALFVFAAVDYHAWARWRRLLYVLMLGLLAAVLALGHHTLGAQRWILIRGFEFQPSEFGKLILVCCLGGMLAPHAGEVRHWRQAIVPTVLAAIPAALVAAEPDLGTSLIFAAALIGVLFAAGFSGVRITAVLLVLAGGVTAAVVAHLRWHVPLPLKGYQLARLLSFINPQADPQNTGWHVIQSETAIGSGRILGTGLFSGGVNDQLQYLPEPQTDFVFASISNTTGFVGAAAVLLVLAVLVWRALRCMAVARDGLGALIAGGIAAILAFQTALNAAVALGVVPVTGVPLPFFSYGGSACLANFAAIGLLESVYVRRKKFQF
jgi:rod shape determining protein RodA